MAGRVERCRSSDGPFGHGWSPAPDRGDVLEPPKRAVQVTAAEHPTVARMAERVVALESRARWFETRVDQLETELRSTRTRQSAIIRRQRGEIDAARAQVRALEDSRAMSVGTAVVEPAHVFVLWRSR